jgi:hypothetical protein
MTKKSEAKNIVEVKTALADKYQRLARTRRSKPGKARLLRHSERFRSQAENIAKSSSK